MATQTTLWSLLFGAGDFPPFLELMFPVIFYNLLSLSSLTVFKHRRPSIFTGPVSSDTTDCRLRKVTVSVLSRYKLHLIIVS